MELKFYSYMFPLLFLPSLEQRPVTKKYIFLKFYLILVHNIMNNSDILVPILYFVNQTQ